MSTAELIQFARYKLSAQTAETQLTPDALRGAV